MIQGLLPIVGVLLGLHVPMFAFLWATLRERLAFHQLALATLLGVCAEVVLTAYALSLIRQLTPPVWLIANVIVSMSLLGWAWRTGVGVSQLRREVAARLSMLSRVWRYPAVCASMILLVAGVFFLFAKAWVYPPYDWDGTNAHLTIARELIQERGAPTQLAPVPRVAFSPFVPQLFFAAALVLPRGLDWANWVNIYFLLLATLAEYAFARQLGIRRAAALLVAPAVFFCPVLFQQATTAYIDLPTAAFVGAALPFLPSRRESVHAETGFAGIALGLALGSKESTVLLLPLVALVILWWAWRAEGPSLRRALPGLALILVVSVGLLGSYRYASNVARTGNPLFPSDVRFAGMHWPGPFDGAIWTYGALYGHPVSDRYKHASSARQVWMSWREDQEKVGGVVAYASDNPIGGFGPAWFVLFLPAITVSALFIRNPKWLSALGAFVVFLSVLPEAPSLARYVAMLFLLGPSAYALVGATFSRGGRAAWQALFVLSLALSFILNLPFAQDADGQWWARLRQECPSLRAFEPSPAAQFLRDVPGPEQTVAAGFTQMKCALLWNERGDDRVEWLLDPEWVGDKGHYVPPPHRSPRDITPAEAGIPYPKTMGATELAATLSDPEIVFVVLDAGYSGEMAQREDYLLVIPPVPGPGSVGQASSPVGVWMHVGAL